MKEAIVFGKNSKKVVNRIADEIDNYTFKPFSTLEEFSNYVKQSHYEFDRVLINTNVVDKNNMRDDLINFYEFIRDNLPTASIVLIVQAKDTSNIQQTFAEIFNLSIYTDATASQTSIQFLTSCIKDKISDIQSNYSVIEVSSSEEGVIAESYEETDEEKRINSIVKLEFDEPIVSDDQINEIDPKNKQLVEQERNCRKLNEESDSVLAQGYLALTKKGMLDSKHYNLTMADVDPTVLLSKKRRSENKPFKISLNKQDVEALKSNLDEPTLLRLAYAQAGNLSLLPYCDSNLAVKPLWSQIKRQEEDEKPKKRGLLGRLLHR